MNLKSLLTAVIAAAIVPFHASAQEGTLPGEPFGYVKVNIAAGTGTAKRTSLVSIPLLDEADITGNATGRITAVTPNTIVAAGAGWQPGELSAAAAPHLIEITSGVAKGRMMLISTATANTTDTLTIAQEEALRNGDLTQLGIATGLESGDTYRIRPVDTLSSFFGTPETTLIHGGPSANSADTVTIVNVGSAMTFFYNTAANPPRWSRVSLGTPDASNTPIPPYAGVQYARLPVTPLEFIVTGSVPSGRRQAAVKNSGTTLLAPFWPVNQTLSSLALQNTPNWRTGPTAADADTVVLSVGGVAQTFFHDGFNWRRVGLGSPLANGNVVAPGASIMINKRGSAAGFASYEHAAPYDLE